MSVLVLMVGELRWGEKGVAKLLGTRRSGCITEKRNVSAQKVREKKEVSEVSKNITSPQSKIFRKTKEHQRKCAGYRPAIYI